MIYNINYAKEFNLLKEFYLPAIYHPVLKGRTKFHQLSVPINGQVVIVKKSRQKFKYASFANVIQGSVLRMKKLFSPDALNLGVQIIKLPDANDLSLSFELVNKNKFIIAGEDYILSIVAEYSYKKMETVTYFPVLYRQVCTNGQVAILGNEFKETISVEKILEVGCEWTRCNFETFSMHTTNYFEFLKRQKLTISEENQNQFIEKILKAKSPGTSKKNLLKNDFFESRDNSVKHTINQNIERLGSTHFALYNALTEFASNESNSDVRNIYLLRIGRYLNNEMRKRSKLDSKSWFENLLWQDVERLTKS